MFDFAALPPEINSGRMYAGPGSGPLMAAAAAWDELAAELGVAASGYNSVVTELTSGPWVGPASVSMVSAISPFVSWLSSLAAQAEETAWHGRAAAAAFEAAFTATVPPPVIAANRVLLANLVATNFFGQNTPAIAVTEAQYMEMWAQDAVAMQGYIAASLTASQFAPFTAPPDTTNADGESGQFAAVAQATAQPAGNTAQAAANTTSQLATPHVLTATAAPQTAPQVTVAATTSGTGSLQDILPSPTNWWSLTPGNYTSVIKQTLQAYFGEGVVYFAVGMAQQLLTGPGGSTVGTGGAWFPTPQFANLGLGNLGAGLGHVGGGVAAGAGQAARVGMLSVPQHWATLTSAVTAAGPDMEITPIGAAGSAGTPGAGANGLLRGMPAGALGRRSAAAGYVNKYGFRYSVLTRPPSAG